jgi:hypothetical protein
MLSDEKLSDLYFNYCNDFYEEAMSQDNPTAAMIDEAIDIDAKNFASLYPEFGKDFGWYAAEFRKRL